MVLSTILPCPAVACNSLHLHMPDLIYLRVVCIHELRCMSVWTMHLLASARDRGSAWDVLPQAGGCTA